MLILLHHGRREANADPTHDNGGRKQLHRMMNNLVGIYLGLNLDPNEPQKEPSLIVSGTGTRFVEMAEKLREADIFQNLPMRFSPFLGGGESILNEGNGHSELILSNGKKFIKESYLPNSDFPDLCKAAWSYLQQIEQMALPGWAVLCSGRQFLRNLGQSDETIHRGLVFALYTENKTVKCLSRYKEDE